MLWEIFSCFSFRNAATGNTQSPLFTFAITAFGGLRLLHDFCLRVSVILPLAEQALLPPEFSQEQHSKGLLLASFLIIIFSLNYGFLGDLHRTECAAGSQRFLQAKDLQEPVLILYSTAWRCKAINRHKLCTKPLISLSACVYILCVLETL